MKKILRSMVIVLVAVMITGCFKQEYAMKISRDEMTLEAISAMQGEYGMNESMLGDSSKLEEAGFKASPYSEGGYSGVKISQTYKLKDISSKEPVTVDLSQASGEDFDGKWFQDLGNNNYKAKIVFDTSAEYDEEMASMASSFVMSFKVELSGKAKSHNADKVEGNTYIWDVTYGEKKNIEFEFSSEDDESSNNMIFIIGAALVAGVGIFLIVLSQKKKRPEQPMTYAGAIPVQPMMQPEQQPIQSQPMTPPSVEQPPVDSNNDQQ